MATTPFAALTDLQTAIKRTFTGTDVAWATDLLAQASDHLRSEVLGWQVYPQVSVKYRTLIRCGEFYRLPSQPSTLTSVVMAEDSSTATVDEYDGGFVPDRSGIATVTYTSGYAAAPAVLRSWTIVLAAQLVENVEKLNLLTSDGLSSVSIDDFKLVWNQQGQGGFGIPPHAVAALQREFTSPAEVTGA